MTSGRDLIHPSACVGERVCFADNVSVGAYGIVGEDAVFGADCELAEHVVVRPRSVLGERVSVDSFAVVGGDPQFSGFDRGTNSRVEIGDDVILREAVTIHRSATDGGATVIGDGVFIMAGGHVAHDCVVGDHAILANIVLLGGHVEVGRHAFLGGAAGVHQFTRIGEGAMLGGQSTATLDVPPFTMISGRNGLVGLNLVGLRRRKVDRADIVDLKACYRFVYGETADPRVRAELALSSGECGQSAVGRTFLEFFSGGKRGFVRPRRQGRSVDDDAE